MSGRFDLMHPWDVTPVQAIAIQQELRHLVNLSDQFTEIRHVAGVDVGFEASGKITRAARGPAARKRQLG